MGKFDPIQENLNGGALSPLLAGAVNLDKYRKGFEVQQNFLSLTQGPVTLRPGTRYIQAVKDSSKKVRLLEVNFSQSQAMTIELGDYYARFYRNQAPLLSGGSPYEIATPYSASEVWQLYYFQSADIIYLLHPEHAPQMLLHYGDADWEIKPMERGDGPYLDQNTTETDLTPSATSGDITLTASPGAPELVVNGDFNVSGGGSNNGDPWVRGWGWSQAANDWALVNGKAVKATGAANNLYQRIRALQAGQSYTVKFTVSGRTAGSLIAGLGGAAGAAVTDNGAVSQTIAAGSGNLLEFMPSADFDGALTAVSVKIVPTLTGAPFFDPGHVGSYWRLYYYLKPAKVVHSAAYSVGDLAYAAFTPPGYRTDYCVIRCTNAGTTGSTDVDISVLAAGDTYTDGSVTWELLNDPSPSGNKTYGWSAVLVTSYLDGWHVSARVMGQLGQAESTSQWREGAWSDYRGWPRAGTFFDGRLILAGTRQQPMTIWGSKVEDFYNHTPQENITSDGPIVFSLDADQVDPIVWLKGVRMLIIGTGSGIWRASGSGSNYQITPTDIVARNDIGEGATPVKPIHTGNVLLFVETYGADGNPGRKLRELAYAFAEDNYKAPDLSILAEHLLAPGIIAMAMQRQPYKCLWAVRADGRLLCMTYERDEGVVGWSEHPMAGQVESVAVIPGAYQDEVWLAVNRTLNGQTVRCVEMLERLFWQEKGTPSDLERFRWQGRTPNVADAFFVDCGKTITNNPAAPAVNGLEHLANMEVNLLADGKPHRRLTVTNDGTLTLDYPAAMVHAGLPILGLLKTLRPEGGAKAGTSQAKEKQVNQVALRLVQSWGGLLGPDADHLEEICPRDGAYRQEVPALITGDVLTDFQGWSETDGQVLIEQDLPLPLTIAAIMPRIVVTEE